MDLTLSVALNVLAVSAAFVVVVEAFRALRRGVLSTTRRAAVVAAPAVLAVVRAAVVAAPAVLVAVRVACRPFSIEENFPIFPAPIAIAPADPATFPISAAAPAAFPAPAIPPATFPALRALPRAYDPPRVNGAAARVIASRAAHA